jgi:hypothetical protein
VYGYDSFNRAAWRQPIGDAKASKELSVRWIIDGDDDDLAAPTAEWPDSHARRMTQLKVRDIRQMKAGRQTSADAATYWEEVHPETHHRIVIKNRADRGLLITMMEQQQQICSVQVKLFTKAGEDESSEKARGRAAAVLIRIGEMYVSGKLASDELYAMRDTIYAEMGISGGRRNISKKPAAVVECRLVEGQAPPRRALGKATYPLPRSLRRRLRSKSHQPYISKASPTALSREAGSSPSRGALDVVYEELPRGPAFSDVE